jgi:hypothetical protein
MSTRLDRSAKPKKAIAKGALMRRFVITCALCVAGCSDSSRTNPSSGGRQTSEAQADENSRQQKPLAATTIDGVNLRALTVLDGKLSLLASGPFTIMGDEILRIKYPNERRPTLVYSNESGTINIAINHTQDRIPQNRLEAFHQQIDGAFRNRYPSATWFNSGIIEINNRNWLNLDLPTPAIDTEIRNMIVGTSLDGRILLVTVNVTRELEKEWLNPAVAIVQSLRIHD